MEVSKINSVYKASDTVHSKSTAKNAENKQEYKQINELSNICYKPLSFGRSSAEHRSWGAVIDPVTKEASFKILTYPDTKGVTVTVKKHGKNGSEKVYELANRGEGIFETPNKIPKGEVEDSDTYFYTIYKGNGDIDRVKDPYSFKQDKLLGESVIYDHSKYQWNDTDWFTNSKERISRKANSQNGLKSLDNAVIYELNTATLTKEGTFNGVKKKLKSIKDLGFNAIELMPVENTYSFNWGYDGVDKLAPAKHLGGPDGLKALIDTAHNMGLNVIMDMVPNHLGPDGASLLKTGPFIKGNNCFGEAFNYEGENSKYVRDYIVNAALNWLENYHCDGLRLDMTKFMDSDYTMKQIAAEVNYHKPDAFLIAEDARNGISVDNDGNFWSNWEELHDKRVVNPLKDYESAEGKDEYTHERAIENISNSNTSLGRLGYDSEWDFNYFHTLKDNLYGIVNLDKFEQAAYCSQGRVKYIMSHDEIGNMEGTRLIAKLMEPMLHISENIILNEEDKDRAKKLSEMRNSDIRQEEEMVKNQKAEFVAEKLAIMLQTGELDSYDTSNIESKRLINSRNKAFKEKILVPLGINPDSGINYDLIKTMYTKSLDKNKMAYSLTYSIPGPTMVFQGDEKAELTPFRFFRQFESVKKEPNLYLEKGYDTGRKGLEESTIGNIYYSLEGKRTMHRFSNLIKDLNKLISENPALTRGRMITQNTVKHDASQVFAAHIYDNDSKNEIFSVTNFNDSDYPRQDAAEYYIKFPSGVWAEILNTDDKKYNGTGYYNNTKTIYSDGVHNSSIKLKGLSNILFKRVG